MFKKNESFVNKGNRLIEAGNTPEGLQTVIQGLDYYQKKVVNSVNPYPSADAGLVVMALRNLANEIERDNPASKPLMEFLSKTLKEPEYTTSRKLKKVKERKG